MIKKTKFFPCDGADQAKASGRPIGALGHLRQGILLTSLNSSYHVKNRTEQAYIEALRTEKNQQLAYIAAGISKARDGYLFFKENEHATKFREFREGTKTVIDLLHSQDFNTFFKVYPAKDYGKALTARQNLRKADLIKTKWFKERIIDAIG